MHQILWALFVIFAIVWLIAKIRVFYYWTERGVKQTSIFYVLIGLLPRWILLKLKPTPYIEFKNKLYFDNPNVRYIGRYNYISNRLNKVLTIKDVDLVKTVLVKNFEHFVDHIGFLPIGVDPYWDRNLFALKGQAWRDMRSTLSPTFTGSKMRFIFDIIEKVAKQMTETHLKQKNDFIEIEVKDFFTKITNDVIATTAFGIEVNTLENPKNEFYHMGIEATAAGNPTKRLKNAGGGIFPDHVVKFFKSIINQCLDYREKNNFVRPDVLQILINIKKNIKDETEEGEGQQENKKLHGKILQLTDDDILAQALVFFFAGFDTVSTAMSYIAYELALNPDAQQKLYEEIINTWQENNGKLTYEIINKMNYMEMAITEALRLWPPLESLNRECTKTFTIPPERPNEKPLIIEAGTHIEIPIFQIHRDPKFYPEPTRYDPERFNKENKDKINPFTFLPFGGGPRLCIGNRLALLELKMIFFYLLKYFEIVPVADTPIPIKFHPFAFSLNMAYPCPLGLKLRK